MTPPSDPRDPLERFVHQALRELPPRRAPRTLESRVLAELARRAALPWWRKSFAHWPPAARLLFVVVSTGLALLTIFGGVWIMAGFDTVQFREAFATPVGWLQTAVALGRVVTDFVDVVIRNIPPLWLYGGLAFIGALYFALFGLGAAAYRTLYVSR